MQLRFDVQLSDRDTISITIASKRELNILDRLVLQLSVKTELHLLELLEEPEQTIYLEPGILWKHGVKNKQSHMHISQWVILINEQIKVGAHKKLITFSKT